MDIVKWLRGHSLTLRIAMRLDEAADEIERLREENTVLSSTLSKLLGKMAADEMAENLLNHGTLTGEE